MRVIMPRDMHGGSNHQPLLRYKREYDGTSGAGDQFVLMQPQELSFGRGTPLSLDLPRSITNIAGALAAPDRRRLRETNANGMFRLFGGHVISTQDVFPFTWGGETNVSLAWRVIWLIQMADGPFVFTAQDSSNNPRVVNLRPAGNGVIELDLFHIPEHEHQAIDRITALAPSQHQIAEHFPLHYGLFGITGTTPAPVYTGLRRANPSPAIQARLGIEPITCLPGGCDDCCPDDNC